MTSAFAYQRPCRLLLLAGALLVVLTASPSWAARPFLVTEPADPLDKGQTRLETGELYQQFSNQNHLSSWTTTLTSGILNDLDFEADVPILFAEAGSAAEDGLGDVTMKFKLRWLRAREGWPVSLATQLIAKLPTCDKSRLATFNPSCTGKTDVGIVGIASKTYRSVTVHLNGGYTVVGGTTVFGTPPRRHALRDALSYSLGFDYAVAAMPVRLIAEVAGRTSADPADSIQPLTGYIAAAYLVNQSITLDVGTGRGLTSSAPQFVIDGGLTIHF